MAEKKKKKNNYTDRPAAEYWNPGLCPVCGNNEFEWGRTSGMMERSFFKPDQPLLAKTRPMKARQCMRCGNVQLFAERD